MPKTLLLADDSVTIQKVVGITFANEDVEIVTVDNGSDALSRAREIRPDLVLADVGMPGLDGYELCTAIKQDGDLAGVPVMLLTGTFESFDENRMREVGADAHIAKPFEAQMLVDQVHALLARGTQEPEPILEPEPIPAPLASDPSSDDGDSGEPDFSFDDLDFASPVPAGKSGERAAPAEAPASAPPPLTLAPIDEDDAFDGVAESLATTERVPQEAADSLYSDADLGATVVTPVRPAISSELPAPDPSEIDAGLGTDVSGEDSAVFGEAVFGDSTGRGQRDVEPPPRRPVTSPPPTPFSREESLGVEPEQPITPERPITRVGPGDSVQAAELLERMANETTTPRLGDDEAPAAEVISEPLPDPLEEPQFVGEIEADDGAPVIELQSADADHAAAAEVEEDFSFADPELDATPEPQIEPEVSIAEEAPLLAEPEPTPHVTPPAPPAATPAATEEPAAQRFELDERSVREAVEKVAWEAFGPLSEQLVGEIVRKLETIAWEVVPKLAERMVREEIERLKRG